MKTLKLDTPKPRRQLGLFDAIMIVMGGIVGAGIFANPSEVAHRVHTPFLILGVWVLGGLFAMCGAFIWAELAMRLPAAGGQYLYLRVLLSCGDGSGLEQQRDRSNRATHVGRDQLFGCAHRQQCAERSHVIKDWCDRSTRNDWVYRWQRFAEIGTLPWRACVIWSLEEHWRCHGSHRFRLRGMADSHFPCG